MEALILDVPNLRCLTSPVFSLLIFFHYHFLPSVTQVQVSGVIQDVHTGRVHACSQERCRLETYSS